MEIGQRSILRYIEKYIAGGKISSDQVKNLENFEEILRVAPNNLDKIRNLELSCQVQDNIETYLIKFSDAKLLRMNLSKSICCCNKTGCAKTIEAPPKLVYYELLNQEPGINQISSPDFKFDCRLGGEVRDSHFNCRMHALIYYAKDKPYVVIPLVSSEKTEITEFLKENLSKNDLQYLQLKAVVFFVDNQQKFNCDLSLLKDIPNVLEGDKVDFGKQAISISPQNKGVEQQSPVKPAQGAKAFNQEHILELSVGFDQGNTTTYLDRCFKELARRRVVLYSYTMINDRSTNLNSKICNICRRKYPKYLLHCSSCNNPFV